MTVSTVPLRDGSLLYMIGVVAARRSERYTARSAACGRRCRSASSRPAIAKSEHLADLACQRRRSELSQI